MTKEIITFALSTNRAQRRREVKIDNSRGKQQHATKAVIREMIRNKKLT